MIKSWWQSRTQRERHTLIVGSALFSLILIYFFIWLPMMRITWRLHQEVVANRNLLTWMQSAATNIARFKNANIEFHKVTASELLATIEETLITTHLKQYASEAIQIDNDKVELSFSSVPFDDFIAWLTTLWKNAGIRVYQIHIQPLEKSGLIKTNVMLQAT